MNLSKALKELINEPVTVELKDSNIICGTIKKIDKMMNMTVEHAREASYPDEPIEIGETIIRGSKIKLISIPESVPLENLIQAIYSSSSN